MNPILFFALSEDVLTEGVKFDAMTFGTFTDMYGHKTTFRKKDLPKYVENTKAVIADSENKGEIVGLPIDAIDHDKGDGAGWIVDAELDIERNIIQLTPNWTSIGVEVIEGKIRRFFSATIDITNKTIMGGTLTNWPAVRDKKGKILLKPVELSSGLFEFEDESLDALSRAVRTAFYDEYGSGDYEADPWVREVFDAHIIVYSDKRDWRVEYKLDAKEGEYTFQEMDDWSEVKQTWIDAIIGNNFADYVKDVIKSLGKPETKSPEINLSEDNTMTINMTQEELEKVVADQVAVSLGAAIKTEFSALRKTIESNSGDSNESEEGDESKESEEVFDILETYDLADQKDLAKSEMAKHLNDKFEAIRAQVKSEAALQIKQIRRETYFSEFANKVTAGNDETPFGLPVNVNELKDWLIGLTPDQAEFAKKLLETVWKSGRNEYTELGHAKETEGTKDLPEDILKDLRSGALTLKDLSDPVLAPSIGDISQYNLTEFRE